MQKPLAIGARLARFDQIITLGARPSLADYPPESLDLIKRADKIYYPTSAFAAQFATMGKRIFPSLECHLYAGDKIKQANLFAALSLDHPRTRVYYGRQCRNITNDFSFPFIAKTPRGSAQGRGVFLISSRAELDAYLALNRPALVQEYLPISGDVRVVVIGFEPICSYWRRPAEGNFRSNLAQGAQVDFSGVPPAAVELAVEAARLGNLDEVGVDVAMVEGRPLLLEFNVKYGHRGPRQAGIDIRALLLRKILAGEI